MSPRHFQPTGVPHGVLLQPRWFKMAPTLADDSAPCAALASPEAQSRPQQPQAAARQLGRQRSLIEGDERWPSK